MFFLTEYWAGGGGEEGDGTEENARVEAKQFLHDCIDYGFSQRQVYADSLRNLTRRGTSDMTYISSSFHPCHTSQLLFIYYYDVVWLYDIIFLLVSRSCSMLNRGDT